MYEEEKSRANEECVTSVTPRGKGEVENQMGILNKAVEELYAVVSCLESRLYPILREIAEKPSEDKCEEPKITPLASEIRKKGSQIGENIEFLKRIQNRLEI